MTIKFKKLDKNAVVPSKVHNSDTGYDVTAVSIERFSENVLAYHTGIAVELPEGWGLQLRPRSSVRKYDLLLCNSVGTIDNAYRGEIIVSFRLQKALSEAKVYEIGDKVAQIILEKIEAPIVWEEVSELSDSDRGVGGHGSSGA
ncbi:deoxyuridine 5'-triphosphate nucleotidohydrolase [Bacteroidia bacterium]|nr:deoxyuridine 5'-triphosphate nucleotidohydrolase [Bacteroidia bacterium]